MGDNFEEGGADELRIVVVDATANKQTSWSVRAGTVGSTPTYRPPSQL